MRKVGLAHWLYASQRKPCELRRRRVGFESLDAVKIRWRGDQGQIILSRFWSNYSCGAWPEHAPYVFFFLCCTRLGTPHGCIRIKKSYGKV